MRRMHIPLAALIAGIGCFAGSPAFAQTAAPTAPSSKGYVEATAQSAFGNVTSQAYGGEVGYTVWKDAQVFAEVGQVRNVATPAISNAAQAIAAALGQVQTSAVSYSVKQPVTTFAAGVRYPIALASGTVRPYVLGAFGAAKVRNDVVFQIGGTDSPSNLAQYVTLGDDLTGSQIKPLVTVGAGAAWPAYRQLIVDFQFRYSRIFAEGGGINIGRAGIGLGVRF